MTALRVRRSPIAYLHAVSCLLAATLAACDVHVSFGGFDGVEGDGIEATEERRVAEFDEVEFTGSGRLEVTVGEERRVAITCDDNLLPLMETEVQGRRLRIAPARSIRPKVDLVVRIDVPSLRAIASSGTGSIEVRGVDEDDFHVDLAGAAKVELQGRADRLKLDLSGVGSVRAQELVAREAVVSVSGVGKADVNATERVRARVSGVGRVTYVGEPVVEKDVSGLGLVSRSD